MESVELNYHLQIMMEKEIEGIILETMQIDLDILKKNDEQTTGKEGLRLSLYSLSDVFLFQIETLSRVNHKNYVNLLGYCEENEPFTRMMVLEYAPSGSLFEHLHGNYILYATFECCPGSPLK